MDLKHLPREVKKIQTVYVDLLFLINFSMDFLCMFLVSKILSKKLSYLRAAIASCLGGAYSVALIFVPLDRLSSIALDLVSLILICIICFCSIEDSIGDICLYIGTYLLSSMLLGGIMTATFSLLNSTGADLSSDGSDDIPPWLFVLVGLASVAVTMFGGRFMKRRASQKTAVISISMFGKSETVNAMCDSGNLLKDSISQKSVIIADLKHAKHLIGINREVDVSMLEQMSDKLKARAVLVPCSTVNKSGIIVAFRPDSIILEHSGKRKDTDALIAFCQIDSAERDCSALFSPELL